MRLDRIRCGSGEVTITGDRIDNPVRVISEPRAGAIFVRLLLIALPIVAPMGVPATYEIAVVILTPVLILAALTFAVVDSDVAHLKEPLLVLLR